MARGGFHGGGHHSGGHHSGGFHGGGFHGGFGGGYRGGHGHIGGTYHGDYGDDPENAKGMLIYIGIRAGIPLTLLLLIGIYENAIPGLNFVNLAIYIVSTILFAYTLVTSWGRTACVSRLFRYPSYAVSGYIRNYKDLPVTKDSYERTWVSTDKKAYQICLNDDNRNGEIIQETLKSTPRIIWMNSFIWLIPGITGLLATFLFYETVIPFFENADMPDWTFKFVDELVFYAPSLLSLISALACFGLNVLRDNLLYRCAVRIVNECPAEKRIEKTAQKIGAIQAEKWYYDNCPNCGAVASTKVISCAYCGSPLEVLTVTSGKGIHRLNGNKSR